jgi:hypothetical protein
MESKFENLEEVLRLARYIIQEETSFKYKKSSSARLRGYINGIKKLATEAKRELIAHDKSYSKKGK